MKADRSKCHSQPKPEKLDEHQLVRGWRAAEKLEPWDEHENEHWKAGYRIYIGMQPRPATRH